MDIFFPGKAEYVFDALTFQTLNNQGGNRADIFLLAPLIMIPLEATLKILPKRMHSVASAWGM